MAQTEDFLISPQTVKVLQRCRQDSKIRLDVSSSTFPTEPSAEDEFSVQVAAAERLLGAIALYVNETMLSSRADDHSWVHVLHLTLERPRSPLYSKAMHSVRFEEPLALGLIKRFGLNPRDCHDALDGLGTDLYDWIVTHRASLEDYYRLVEGSPREADIEVRGHPFSTASQILGETVRERPIIETKITREH